MKTNLNNLLAKIADGDQRSFASLYQQSLPTLTCVARAVLKMEDWVHDVLHDSYLLVWHKASQFNPQKGSPMDWMTTIVRNQAINQLRRMQWENQRKCSIDDDNSSFELSCQRSTPCADNEHYQLMEKVVKRMSSLDCTSQRALMMAHYEGRSREEIADNLNLPINTVKSKIRRSIIQLQASLQ